MKYPLDRVSVRLVKEPPLLSDRPITGPESAVGMMQEYLRGFDREVVAVVNLRNDGTPVNMNVMSVGTVNASIVNPREALKASILSNACSVLLFHNHPSGSLKPSAEDISTTDRMIRAYELMGIAVLDHIIIGQDGRFYSMLAHGVFPSPKGEYEKVLEDLEFPVRKREKGKER